MKTNWLKVLDDRLEFTPDPVKWATNTAFLEKHKYHIHWLTRSNDLRDCQSKAVVNTVLEWVEENKPRKAADPFDIDTDALASWIQSYPMVSCTFGEGDDSHAGMRIPYITKTYHIEGRVFKISTYPDWDNYQEDMSIYMDAVLIAIYQG